MWVLWAALIFVGVVFVCCVAIALYFDIRGFLETSRSASPAATPDTELSSSAPPEEPALH